MTFSEQLNAYISELNCTAKELTDVSGLSASVLSRYRTGSRIPTTDSEQFMQLVQGIATIANERGYSEFTVEKIQKTLEDCLQDATFPYELFQINFDKLLTSLSINVADLSHFSLILTALIFPVYETGNEDHQTHRILHKMFQNI